MPKVYQRATARRDLVEQFVYLVENASLDTAERFLTNAEISFNDLADQPMIGAALAVRQPALAGIRKWRVKDFDNHLILYRHVLTACPSCAYCKQPGTGGVCWVWRISGAGESMRKAKSAILEPVHDSAKGLHKVGVMDRHAAQIQPPVPTAGRASAK